MVGNSCSVEKTSVPLIEAKIRIDTCALSYKYYNYISFTAEQDCTHFSFLIYRKVSTPAIRVRKASTNCTSNLRFLYIKTELDVHLVIKEVGYYGQEEVCLRKLGYVAVPSSLT